MPHVAVPGSRSVAEMPTIIDTTAQGAHHTRSCVDAGGSQNISEWRMGVMPGTSLADVFARTRPSERN